MQARTQITPSASWAVSERRGPGVRWPRVAITMACPPTKMQEVAIKVLKDNQRGGRCRVVSVECKRTSWRVAQPFGRGVLRLRREEMHSGNHSQIRLSHCYCVVLDLGSDQIRP